MSKHTVIEPSEFERMVKPTVQKLLILKAEFHALDLCSLSNDAIVSELALIEQAEQNVLLAWANSTRSINPTMLADVQRGMKLSPKMLRQLSKEFNL